MGEEVGWRRATNVTLNIRASFSQARTTARSSELAESLDRLRIKAWMTQIFRALLIFASRARELMMEPQLPITVARASLPVRITIFIETAGIAEAGHGPKKSGDPTPPHGCLPIRHVLQIESPALFRCEFYAILGIRHTFTLEVLKRQSLQPSRFPCLFPVTSSCLSY